MNKVALVGRLTKDPELRTGETAFARLSVAVNRPFKNDNGEYDADFPNCVAFGKTAEFVEKYFVKGDPIGITGRIQTGSYTNKNGDKVYTTDVVVETAEFVGNKNNDDSGDYKRSKKRRDDDEYEKPKKKKPAPDDDEEYEHPKKKRRPEPDEDDDDDSDYPF